MRRPGHPRALSQARYLCSHPRSRRTQPPPGNRSPARSAESGEEAGAHLPQVVAPGAQFAQVGPTVSSPVTRREHITEPAFRWALVENQMAGQKLTGGLWLLHRDDPALRRDSGGQMKEMSM